MRNFAAVRSPQSPEIAGKPLAIVRCLGLALYVDRFPALRRALKGALTAALAGLVFSGCGQPGPPLPPSANIPAAPAAFSAQRDGANVVLRWPAVLRTTDGAALRGLAEPMLCIRPTGAGEELAGGLRQGLHCPHLLPLSGRQGTVVPLSRLLAVSPDLSEAPGVILNLAFTNRAHVLGPFSDRQIVSTAPVSAPPVHLWAQLDPHGVLLRWSPVNASAPELLRVYRTVVTNPKPKAANPSAHNAENGILSSVASPANAPPPGPQALADVPLRRTSFLDRTTQFGQTYIYYLRTVNREQVVSQPSASVEITTRDVFAPPAPQGLQVVLTPNGVDLSWEPLAVPDLGGYSVYRLGASGIWTRLTPALLVTPVFHDPSVPAGRWQYRVTASNQNNVEGPPSSPSAITVPPSAPAPNPNAP